VKVYGKYGSGNNVFSREAGIISRFFGGEVKRDFRKYGGQLQFQLKRISWQVKSKSLRLFF